MKRSIFFGIIAAVLMVAALVFVGCEGKNGGNSIVRYAGKVVYAGTSTPFPNLEIKVTNGDKIHCLEHTNAEGQFVLTVNLDDINGDYYVLAGDSTCLPKRVNLPGFGQEQFDLGTIEVEGPSLPVVVAQETSSISGTSAIVVGNVTSSGRLPVSARGVCYSTQPYPTLEQQYSKEGEGVGLFNSKLKDLTPKTMYYVRAYATNRMGTAYSEQIAFMTTDGTPRVQTKTAVDVTFNSALLSGEIVDNGGYDIDDYGLCWSESMTPTITDQHHSCRGQVDFACKVSELKLKTTYYVRAYAHNEMGLSYGNEIMFTTIDCFPVLATAEVSDIHSVSAVCGGTISSDGGYNITARGVCWSSTSAAPTINDNHTTDGSGKGTFVSHLINLQPQTTYYVRAYATNSAGTAYGNQIQFYTIDGLPIVQTSNVSGIQGSSAICGGNVTDDGGYSITARGICWSSTSAAPTTDDDHTSDGVGLGTFVSQMKDLNESTSYYVRAYATNATGTSYGKQVYFTTSIDHKNAIVKTLPATDVTSSAATLNGSVSNEGYPVYTERGFCYNSSGMPTIYDTKIAVAGSGTGNYTSRINILIQDYYVRAYVIQEGQVIYGEQVFFAPEMSATRIFMGNVTNVGANSATVSATISDAGKPAYSKRGFCYGEYADPTIESGNCVYVEEAASNAEVYNMTLTNLKPDTYYYVKAYVEWLGHRIYTNVAKFQTNEDVTVVAYAELVGAECVVSQSGITWKGLIAGGISSSVSYLSLGFVIDTNPNPAIGKSTTTQLAWTGTETSNGNLIFYANASGLENGKNYYVRAYVQMSYGYVYSDQVTIQMHPIDPVVKIHAVANLESVNESYWKAQFQGIFYTDGTPPAVDWGFVYGTSSNPSADDGESIVVSRQQHVAYPNSTYYVFATNVTGLKANSIYYVRAFAKTPVGYTYSGATSFSTY